MDDAHEPAVFYPLEYVGTVDVSSDVLKLNDVELRGVGSGYSKAMIYVRRISGQRRLRPDGSTEQLPGLPIAEIHIEIIGDSTSEQWLRERGDADVEEDVALGYIDVVDE